MITKKRKYITFTEEMISDLTFLLEKKRVERKKSGNHRQYHEKDLIAELLHNARELKEAWG